MDECPFCPPNNKKSTWYFYGALGFYEDTAVQVVVANDAGRAFCLILFTRKHMEQWKLKTMFKHEVERLMNGIANAVWGDVYSKREFDWNNKTYQHAHVQLLRR